MDYGSWIMEWVWIMDYGRVWITWNGVYGGVEGALGDRSDLQGADGAFDVIFQPAHQPTHADVSYVKAGGGGRYVRRWADALDRQATGWAAETMF